ncbi:MAG: TMEM165/GDT1 family protein [Sphingobacteriia bacterium]|nr:TMEM165/GDT1 family protein [Sphingobacteriia bacterium]
MNTQTFIVTMLVVAIVEMGDKTQLMTMAFASKYKVKDILFGITLSIILLNLIAVGLGTALSNILPLNFIHLLAGISFLIFALWSILSDEAISEKNTCSFFGRMPVSFVIAVIFFMSELGDKTQLYIISIAAAQPDLATVIFLGATFGLVLADAIGLIAGLLLRKNLPSDLMKWISYCIFSCYGFLTLNEYLHYFWLGYEKTYLVVIAMFFVILTISMETLQKRKENMFSFIKYHSR